MSDNAFIGKKDKPTEDELAAALGSAKTAWDRLLADLATEHGVDRHEWNSYSPKSGWALKACRKKRTVIWLAPRAGCFGANFIFGAKAMTAIRQCEWPAPITKALAESRKYPEGTGVRIEASKLEEIAALTKLAAIKLAN
jgi:hypothetical protein